MISRWEESLLKGTQNSLHSWEEMKKVVNCDMGQGKIMRVLYVVFRFFFLYTSNSEMPLKDVYWWYIVILIEK